MRSDIDREGKSASFSMSSPKRALDGHPAHELGHTMYMGWHRFRSELRMTCATIRRVFSNEGFAMFCEKLMTGPPAWIAEIVGIARPAAESWPAARAQDTGLAVAFVRWC